jgi:hypothetical protein
MLPLGIQVEGVNILAAMSLAILFVYDLKEGEVFDPDQQVHQSNRSLIL